MIVLYVKLLYNNYDKTMCGRSCLISSDSYLVSAYEFMDETP